MEDIKSLELKIKLLEIENQKLSSTIELNKKEIAQYKSLIKSLSENNTLNNQNQDLTQSPYDKVINLKFGWTVNDKAHLSNNSKTVRKIGGGSGWNCSSLGDKSLIPGAINKWKIQLTKYTGAIVLGIVPKGTDINGIDNWKKGYVTCSGNFAKHNLGICTEFAKHQASEGNILEVIVDLEKGELSFSVNGINQGLFCQNIIKDIEYLPFVDIDTPETEITLL